jgi:hypothetical protein
MFILPNNCCCGNCTVTVVLPNYVNESTVDGYPDTPTPPIEPYPRPANYWNSGDECGAGNQPLCDRWPRAERPGSISTNWNVYTAGEGNTTRTQEVKGTKIKQSRKAFHGRLPFTFCPGPCATLPSKYLGVSVTCDVVFTPGGEGADPDANWASHYVGAFGVSATSGIITGTGTATASVGTTAGYSEEDVKYFARTFAVTRTSCIDVEGTPTPQWDGALYTGLETPAASRLAHLLARIVVDAANDYFPNIPEGDIDVSINSLGSTVLELEATWNPGASYEGFEGGSSVYFYLKVELDEEAVYTPALVEGHILDGTSVWSLSNDSYLPWRTDGYRGKGVIARYDEVASAVDPDLCGFEGSIGVAEGMAIDGTYTDPNPEEVTGTIIGEPFTGGWPNWSFGFDQLVYWYLNTSPTIAYYGAFTDGTIIPHTATIWTNEYFAGLDSFWPGSGYHFDADEEVLHAQPTLEVKPKLPSYDFFEPCRLSRWLPDSGAYADGTTAVVGSTVTDITGSTVTTDDDISAAFGGEERLVVFNKGTNDGEVWFATASGTTITLTSQLVTASGEWTALIARVQAAHLARKWVLDQGTFGRITLLRFQEPNVPDASSTSVGADSGEYFADETGHTWWPASRAIAGRVAVTAAYDGGTNKTTFTLATAQELITGDRVTVLDASNAVLAPNLPWTWVSNTSGTVPGDHSAGAAFLKSRGAPYHGWHDVASYGDFVVREINSVVTAGVYSEPGVLSQDTAPGDCVILACTPDGDAPEGAHSVAFPTRPAFTICGGRRWKQFVTVSLSPIWQTPVSDYDIYDPLTHGCPDNVEPRLAERTGLRGGEACPALPPHCVFRVSATPEEGSGWDVTTANTGNGPWMDTCVY